MNLLEVVQAASDELGLPHPTSALANGNLTVVQLVSLVRAAGAALVKRHEWRMLYERMALTTVGGTQFYALPLDFGRIVNRTAWDETNAWALDGPLLTTTWQAFAAGIGSDTTRIQFRLNQNRIEVRPDPVPAAYTLSAYYVSKWWIYTAGLTDIDPIIRQSDFDDDTNLIAFDDRLIVDLVKLKFLQAKGLDTSAVAQDFQNSLDDAVAQDAGATKLSLSCPRTVSNIVDPIVPDSGYG